MMTSLIGLDAVAAAALADDLLAQGETLQSFSFSTTTRTNWPGMGPLLLLDGSTGSPLRRDRLRSTPLWQL
jgi:hypothetical protein